MTISSDIQQSPHGLCYVGILHSTCKCRKRKQSNCNTNRTL